MRRAFPPRLAVLVGYVLAALAFTWPLPLRFSTELTGDPSGDTGVYVWNQWVFYQELIAGHNPLTTEKILALSGPPVDLTQHNYTAFLNILALPFIKWIGIIAAFNLVFLTICVLNGVAMYGLARRVTAATRWEAWLAGLLFAWSPAMVARTTGHFSLVAAAALPAFMWCLVNAERSRSMRDAALVGVCMAWAALSDAYFGIYCVLVAALYVAASLLKITRGARANPRAPVWLLDVLIVCLSGLIAGLLLGSSGEFTLAGVPIHVRTLYTPVMLLTILVLARVAIWWRPQFDWTSIGPLPVKALIVAVLACVGPLSPVLYGLGTRVVGTGNFVNPQIFWRSSPRGVDALSFFTPNPQHPLMRALYGDQLASAPTVFVEYTASLSLVAIAIILVAMWRARYRPHGAWVGVTIGFALLALGPFVYVGGINTYIPGPWALLRYVPIVGLARMPTRFAVVAAIGLAVLMAGALAALGARWPHRRRWIGAVAGVLLVFELWPGPRTLYSAAISPVYDRIAADPRDVRVLVLPFGVRDGTWETGNFRPATQFNQTRHGKALIGGYLSRVSQHRVERMRQDYPTLDALIALSEDRPLGPEVAAILEERGDRLMTRGNVGYVVIDSRFIPPDRARLAIDALDLREIERDDYLTLYVPAGHRP